MWICSLDAGLGWNVAVDVVSHTAYVADNAGGLFMVDYFNPNVPRVVGHYGNGTAERC